MDEQTVQLVEAFRALRRQNPELAAAMLELAKAMLRDVEKNQKR